MADADRVVGEAGVIETFMAPLTAGFAGALGLTDDCAELAPPPGEDLVLKTDAVAEGVHFLASDDPADIGWKALAVNVSDLAAKGARPLVYLMALSFPEAPRTSWLAGFAAGLGAAQRAFAIHLAGGDTDRRPGPVSITITVIGSVPAGRMVRRAAARAGDRLVVSGTLGDAALGLALARDPGLARAWGLDAAETAHLLARYRRPSPRLGLSRALREHAGAAMDLSDGLAKDLGRMARASGVGAVVEASRLPLSTAARKAVGTHPDLLREALAGGDDYEILVSLPPDRLSAFAAAAAPEPVTQIGVVTAGQDVVFTDEHGRPILLPRTGWDHF